jgi:copper chaperone CopZ
MLTSNEKIILTAKIDGIACSACINRITNKLKKIPFVYDVSINLIDSKALITVDKNLLDLNSKRNRKHRL